MPRLIATEAPPQKTSVEFVFSPILDMMNAMYFTHLITDSEGVEGWPQQLRHDVAPDLLAELDFLYSFPNGQPGMLGQLGDILWGHPETWDSIDALVSHIRNMPAGLGEYKRNPGIQGLAYYFCCIRDEPEPPMSDDPREALRLKIDKDGATDVDAKIAVWERPEELRERMINLVQRFYAEHYAQELPKRRAILERSVAARRGDSLEETLLSLRKLLGRPALCFEEGQVCDTEQFSKLIFSPSLDMGPYASCAIVEGPRPLHGLFYPVEAEFLTPDTSHANDIQRFARLYKALSDEQRLRILNILGDREMYAQEIVDRMDLHQSVVSRHLQLLRAVGVLQIRKHNNMKYYSLNPAIQDELNRTMELFSTPKKGGAR